jgi:thioredoxin 1
MLDRNDRSLPAAPALSNFNRLKVKNAIMKNIFSIVLLSTMTFFVACQNTDSNGQTNQVRQTIPVDQFEQKMAQTPNVQLVDVRTADEYSEGHLKNARNMNVNREDYKEQFGTLDKNRPVFVYCLSGGRSGNAAKIMEKMGFKEIYNMEGGIMKWDNAGKPIEHGNAPPKADGMTTDDLNKLVSQKKYVLVDYNAPWCAPCKKMLPILESLAQNKKDKLALVKINADDNKGLLKEKGISGIPYLELYLDGKLVWKHDGFIDEKQLLEETHL